MDLREKQLQYELDSDAEAAIERLNELRAAAREGDLNTPRAIKFIASAFSTVETLIKEDQAVATRGVGGKFKGWLRKVPADVAAVIALRTCIETCMVQYNSRKPVTFQVLARAIGRLYESEVRIRELETVNPLYMARVQERLKTAHTTSQKHLKGVYDAAYKVVMQGELDSKLTDTEAIHLGKFGLQACYDAGIVTSERTWAAGGQLVPFELTPEVYEFLTGYDTQDVAGVLNHTASAMLCPPDPWTTLTDGGYLSPRRKLNAPFLSLRGVRRTEHSKIRAAFTAQNMPLVFDVANYLQSIPYSLHKATTEAIQRVWKAGGGVLGVPLKSGPVKPEMPMGAEWDKAVGTPEELAVFNRWKRRMVAYYDSQREWKSHVRELSGFLKSLNRGHERMWFPVFVDSRGRWYYRGSPNPQGSDMSKGVLHFADKKPLGKRGLFWLKVHIANSFGFDKKDMETRAAWTDQHWEAIERALDAPEDYPDVWGTDAPWVMYSAAYELREAYRSGDPYSYECGVPVAKDATCSGLQHFSALLRDPIGGKFVNLTESTGTKEDIYMKVADNTLMVIRKDSENPDPLVSVPARFWLKHGVPRALVKKPVMTYVYGATFIGVVWHVEAYIDDELKGVIPDAEPVNPYSQYLARKLFQGISSTVPAAAAAMAWLKKVAGDTPKGQRMVWKSPTGFLVQHDYQDYDEHRVRVRSCGLERVLVREYNGSTKPKQMQSAIAPNFIHALDASHLAFTAKRMSELGISLVGVHDSFGTHACDVDYMDIIIRQEFYNMYKEQHYLADFLWEVGGVGETPNTSTLDLQLLLSNEFIFS